MFTMFNAILETMINNGCNNVLRCLQKSYNAYKNACDDARAGYNATNNGTINEQWTAILSTILLQY